MSTFTSPAMEYVVSTQNDLLRKRSGGRTTLVHGGAGLLTTGVPLMAQNPAWQALYPNARLIVEWSPTASFTSTLTVWTWEDITSDILIAEGRSIQLNPFGRNDSRSEAQPSGLRFTLDNRSGDYSRGPQSRNYPNVRPSVPVRLSVSLDGTEADRRVMFSGYIASISPTWDSTGVFAMAEVQAAGSLRRLGQASDPLRSALYRGTVRSTPGPVAYWPMEDAGGVERLASAVTNGKALDIDGAWTFQSSTTIAGSAPITQLSATSTYTGFISGRQTTGFQVDVFFELPAAPVAETSLIRIGCRNSTVARWDVNFPAGATSGLKLVGVDSSGGVLVTATYALGTTVGVGGMNMRFTTKQNGANIDWKLMLFPTTTASGFFQVGSFAGTWGPATFVTAPAQAGMANALLGHIAVWDAYDHVQADGPTLGWERERAISRFSRLCAEENIPEDSSYFVGPDDYEVNRMGVQTPETLLNLLKETAVTTAGLLYDGTQDVQGGHGALRLLSRTARENRTVELTLSATSGDIIPPFGPESDDSELVNRATSTRKNGPSATYEQTDGELGTDRALIYDSSETVSLYYDDLLPDRAAWMVHMGTVPGYRYPSVDLIMNKIPAKASAVLGLTVGDRVNITDIGDWLPTTHPTGTIRQVVEGFNHSITNMQWTTTLNLSSAEPWDINTLGADAPTTDPEYVAVLDEDGMTSVDAEAVGSTTFRVNFPANSNVTDGLTTDANDLPLTLEVGGWVITGCVPGSWDPVTRIHTVACDPFPGAALAGAEVHVYSTPHLSL